MRAAHASFERAVRLLDEVDPHEPKTTGKVREEAAICRELCDRVLDVSRLLERAKAHLPPFTGVNSLC